MGKSNNNSKLKILFSVITIIMTILICIFIIYALKVGVFESPEKLVKYIKGYGVNNIYFHSNNSSGFTGYTRRR